MNFVEIQNELIAFRFDERRRESIKKWINARYQWINAQAEWPWSFSESVETVLAGSNNVSVNYTRINLVALEDDPQSPIIYVDPEAFFQLDSVKNLDTGNAGGYTVIPDPADSSHMLLYLDFATDGDTDLRVTGTTRPADLVNNGDEPVFPSGFHYILVLGATSMGLKMENDPTWQDIEAEFMNMLDGMKEQVLPPARPSTGEYGRDLHGTDFDSEWMISWQ